MHDSFTIDDLLAVDDDELDYWLFDRLIRVVDARDPAALHHAPLGISALLVTVEFEAQVGNGGLFQYFFNVEDPGIDPFLVNGYRYFGLTAFAELLSSEVLPAADRERAAMTAIQAAPTAGAVVDGYSTTATESGLKAFDDQVWNVIEGEAQPTRRAYVRSHPIEFGAHADD